MSNAEHLKLVEPAPARPADPLIGHTIDGRYLMERVLGQGGMGVVYKAKHVVLGKSLAIKVLKSDVSRDQEIMQRFRQEAQSASAIGSQHIIDISDFGQLPDGSTYFVMEFLDGRELTKVIESDLPLPPERVVGVAKQLCDALGAAHERGIVHRDMKPDNVFLVKRGGTPDFVKVLDFGIAKVGGASSKLTRAGQVFGTPHYMSPEQCSGQMVDHRTDIYALGVILYELACGRVPFDADNLMGILTKHIYEQPIPPHNLPPPVNVPAGLEAVIMKCLAKQADARYQSMAEVKADLEAFERGQTPNAVIQAVDRTTQIWPDAGSAGAPLHVEVGGAQPSGGSKLPFILGGLFGLFAVAGAGLALWFFVLAPSTPQITTVEHDQPTREPTKLPDPRPIQNPTAQNPTTNNPAQSTPQPPIRVVSQPVGVEVWSSDGALLGNTPFEIPRPEGSDRVILTLKMAGYQDHQVSLNRFTQAEVRVTLTQRPSSSSSSSSGGGHRRRHDRPAATTPTPTPPTTPTPPPRRTGGNSEVLDPWGQPR